MKDCIVFILILVVVVGFVRGHLADLNTKPPMMRYVQRFFFLLVGAGAAVLANGAVHDGEYRVGGNRTPVQDRYVVSAVTEPVRFWIPVSVVFMISGIAFYGAFGKGKP
jgi:hypothetical protein